MNRYEKGFVAYVVIAIALSGPALIDAEHSEAAAKKECDARNATTDVQKMRCDFLASAPERAFPRVLFWPAWLSYVAARKLST